MITIDQGWVYVPEACDCCRGTYDEVFFATVNGVKIDGWFETQIDALRAAIEKTGVKVDFEYEDYPEDND